MIRRAPRCSPGPGRAALFAACACACSSNAASSTDAGIRSTLEASATVDAFHAASRDAGSRFDGSATADAAASRSEGGIDAAAPDSGWVLTWSDEFNESDGGAPDPAWWTYTSINGTTSGVGWGIENDTPSGVALSNGNLVFTATADSTGVVHSGAIDTKAKFEQAYGRFEARIKVAPGAGAWSAFWLMGDTNGASWPTCGEIDVVEVVDSAPTNAYATIHSGNTSNPAENTATSAFYAEPSGDLSDDFHLYAVEWAPDSLKFSVDGTPYETDTMANLTTGQLWAFDHSFYVILNLEVGGSWAGPPSASSFPMTMLVDYVRVYKAAGS